MKAPLLIQIDLLGNTREPVRAHWLPLLSELKQAERPLVLLAERPDRWTPTRNRVDKAFMRQADIEAEVRRAGGALDAIVYLDFGLFGKKRQYRKYMADVAKRYDCKLEDMHAIARAGRITDALQGIIGSIEQIDDDKQLKTALQSAVRESQAQK